VNTAAATGFSSPFSGPLNYEHLAPPQVSDPSQLNQPLGQDEADKIATKLGLRRADSLTEQQYLEFISGGGIGGNNAAAQLIAESIRIFDNTIGHPLFADINGTETPTVLGSYGLYVTPDGVLQSPGNAAAPTRKANAVVIPGTYMQTWMLANGAARSWDQFNTSAYPVEALYGAASQALSSVAELAPNTKGGVSTHVGMAMAPSIWLTNFILLYTWSPAAAADMPAYWAPIPAAVADALLASPTGQVPYSEFESNFQ